MNVFEYGFSFFIDAINEHQLISNSKRKDMAIAVRVATQADKIGWKQFMKRK